MHGRSVGRSAVGRLRGRLASPVSESSICGVALMCAAPQCAGCAVNMCVASFFLLGCELTVAPCAVRSAQRTPQPLSPCIVRRQQQSSCAHSQFRRRRRAKKNKEPGPLGGRGAAQRQRMRTAWAPPPAEHVGCPNAPMGRTPLVSSLVASCAQPGAAHRLRGRWRRGDTPPVVGYEHRCVAS